MEPAAAACFLHPSTVVLSLAAVSPTLGDPHPPFHSTIYSLITKHNPRQPLSYAELSSSLEIPFTPSESLITHHQLTLPPTPTVATLVDYLISYLSTTPHSLHQLATLLEPQCDPALHGSYEPTSRLALFLRKTLVAFHSLTFFTHARLTTQLQSYSAAPAKLKASNPSATELTRRADPAAAQFALHEYCDRHPPHKAALELIPFHASFNRPKHASIAVHHALHAAQAVAEYSPQKSALRWLAAVETPEKRVTLLQHVKEPLMRDRDALLGLRAKGRYQALKKGTTIDRYVLHAAAWEVAASVPTALAVARMAWRRVGNVVNAAGARAGIAVADLMALQGDYKGATDMLNAIMKKLTIQETGEKTMQPELMLVTRARTWMQLERGLRRREMQYVRHCVDKVMAYAQAGVNNATLFSVDDLAFDALEASCRSSLLFEDALSARRTANELTKKAAVAQRPARAVEGMRLQAEAFLLGGSAIKALPIALRAVALAKGLKLYGLHVTSSLTLVETMLEVEDDGYELRALAALVPVLPTALEGLGLGIRARALRLHAECLIAADAEADRMPEGRSLTMLAEAMQAYESFDDIGGVRSCAYTLARVYDWRGDFGDRDKAANHLQQVSQMITRREWSYEVREE